MRIAYIAPYQGPSLIKRRPTTANLSLAGNVKVELISELLEAGGHTVEVLSQGEVVERQLRYFPPFREPSPFKASIPVFYASALPIRFVNGIWSNNRLLKLLKERHRANPFDLVVIYNLKQPQVRCAMYAEKQLGLPVVLEYEDDAFVSVGGQAERGVRESFYQGNAQNVLKSADGALCVSPYLMSQFPKTAEKLLLRGVVNGDVLNAGLVPSHERKNWVIYSGTHYRSKGLEPLIEAWKGMDTTGWELHFSGNGELTEKLHQMAKGVPGIVFHGLLNRDEYAKLLACARIGINPHDVSATPGNVFAFKIIEYIAAGLHVVSTPMGALEPEVEHGITYMPDNLPDTIRATLSRIWSDGTYNRLATQAVHRSYSPEAIAGSLDQLVRRVAAAHRCDSPKIHSTQQA